MNCARRYSRRAKLPRPVLVSLGRGRPSLGRTLRTLPVSARGIRSARHSPRVRAVSGVRWMTSLAKRVSGAGAVCVHFCKARVPPLLRGRPEARLHDPLRARATRIRGGANNQSISDHRSLHPRKGSFSKRRCILGSATGADRPARLYLRVIGLTRQRWTRAIFCPVYALVHLSSSDNGSGLGFANFCPQIRPDRQFLSALPSAVKAPCIRTTVSLLHSLSPLAVACRSKSICKNR
jgi:hypothetical protein